MTNKETETELYPKWLTEKAFSDSFDWENGTETTLNKFLEFATLHDSYWCGLFNYLDNSVNLILNFDAFWNKELANHKSAEVKEWPYLIIKVKKVFSIIFDSDLTCGTTVRECKTELIDNVEKEKYIDISNSQKIISGKLAENILDDNIYKTLIEDVCGGFIELVHKQQIQILLIEENGEIIKLPEELKIVK
jgi:hypothetical protein